MEKIERLPFGQSHADKCRAGNLRWLNMPPGIPPEMATQFMAGLRSGKTLRILTSGDKKSGPAIVTPGRFKKHCQLNPEWGAEAMRLAKENQQAALRVTGAVDLDLARERSAAKPPTRRDSPSTTLGSQLELSVLKREIAFLEKVSGRAAQALG
jgi:hypothetical protein